MKHISELRPDPKNARRHTPRNVGAVEHSIQRDGFGRSILVAKDGTIIAGNATIEAAAAAGIENVVVVESDGKSIIAVKRTDIDPDSPEFYNLALSDNRAAELADWNPDVLASLADDGVDLSQFWFEDELADVLATDDDLLPVESENDYTTDTPSPIYEPTGEQPDVSSLMDTTRRDELARDIAAADLPDDVREFLNAATTRHVVFDYRKIAEYYAHADADVQRLMEDSALVIIDFNRAIELGYVRLSSRLNEILGETHDDDAA